ncbi:MAG: ATPase, T2SS/T4P/T4SS family, partial [Candidatus Omnitrophica bacterium]|nr:ATPase, T2SS/T4P/T4SS family [Candidatus Omnitrophota bacterium]
MRNILKLMIEKDASDLFIKLNSPVSMRIYGKIVKIDDFPALNMHDINKIIDNISTEKTKEFFSSNMDVDFAFNDDGLGRFRVSLFLQRGVPSIVIRRIKEHIGNFSELNLPGDVLAKLTQEMRGLVILTGPAGNGKSTTIASMIDYINEHQNRHIITIEDPIEFIFPDK